MAKQARIAADQDEEQRLHRLAPFLAGNSELEGARSHLKRPLRSILKTPDTSHDSSRSSCREVTFETITVRRYPMEMGDHPSCSLGAPVSLAWDYIEEEPVDIDIYECERGRRRPLGLLILSYYRRRDILRNAGYSDQEIQSVSKKVAKTQRQRGVTRFFAPASRLEHIAASAGRKIKRMVNKDARKFDGAHALST